MEKLYILIFSVIFLCMLTVPLISVENNDKNDKIPQKTESKTSSVSLKNSEKSEEKKVKIYLSDKKQISEITLSEYLVGVVMTEMDESYPDEALKAQAVAAHTLLLYRQKENKDKDYDITDSYTADQGYMNKASRREKYGKIYKTTENRVKKLVNSVKNKVIYYKNEPILAVYHDTSGGKTENAKDIWGGDYPYLVSVESISDLLNPSYLSTVTYTKQEFESRLKGLGVSLPKSEKKYIGNSKTTESGTVKQIVIAGKTFSGQKIREAFNLRSANFDLKYEDKKFVFTVRGFGHGVGMSQYGALFMAKEGSNYKEILKWYYTGCEIK